VFFAEPEPITISSSCVLFPFRDCFPESSSRFCTPFQLCSPTRSWPFMSSGSSTFFHQDPLSRLLRRSNCLSPIRGSRSTPASLGRSSARESSTLSAFSQQVMTTMSTAKRAVPGCSQPQASLKSNTSDELTLNQFGHNDRTHGLCDCGANVASADCELLSRKIGLNRFSALSDESNPTTITGVPFISP